MNLPKLAALVGGNPGLGIGPIGCELTEDEVKTFRRFLRDRSDPSLLLPFLEGYGSCKKQECHWIQLENEDVVAWNDKTIHNSTTGCVLSWTEGDKVFWSSPQSTLRTSGSSAASTASLIASSRSRRKTVVVRGTGSESRNSVNHSAV